MASTIVFVLIAVFTVVAAAFGAPENHAAAEPGAGCTNWAVRNLFFSGEVALALISANALWTSRHMRPAAAAH